MPILAASRLMLIVVAVAAAIDFSKIYDGYCMVLFSGISAFFVCF